MLNCIVAKEEIPDEICSVGIHPWYISESHDDLWEVFQCYTRQKNVLAIGECGLDKLTATDWELQIYFFEKQIQWANATKKPLIIHCVRAYQEVLAMLKDLHVVVPVIFHGFNKKAALASTIIEQGFYLSLGSSILYGAQDDLLRQVDLSKIFFETDNKSINVVDIYSYFCSVRKIKMSDLVEQINENFRKVFIYNNLG